MKTIFGILLLLTFSSSFSSSLKAQHKPKKAEPKTIEPINQAEEAKMKKNGDIVVFDKYVIERENIPYGKDESFVFTFKNKGKAPVVISEVMTSCGCTTASKPTEAIKPGKKGKIVVKYDTKRTGNFQKEITIKTSIQTEPIILMIKGNVLLENGSHENGLHSH